MTESARAFLELIPHLSSSSVSDFLTCPLLWAGRRMFKWPEPATPALAIGTAVHAALAAVHQGEDGELALLEAWKLVRPMGPPAGSLERSLEALAIYTERATIAPLYDRPETFIHANVPGIPVPFIGYLDCIAQDNTIHEWKTGKAKYWSQQRVDTAFQATAYWWLHVAYTGQPPKRIVLHAMNTASSPVSVTQYETHREPAQLDGFVETVQEVYAAMCAEDLEPKCKPDRCRFPEQCGAYRTGSGKQPMDRLKVPAAGGVEVESPRIVEAARQTAISLMSRCPECGGERVERTNRESGMLFFGCASHPACTWTMPLPADQVMRRAGVKPLPGFE